MEESKIRSARQILQGMRETLRIFETSSLGLNSLLKGGLYVEQWLEIVGSSGSGKTQLCLSLALHLAANIGCNVLYIDASNSFSALRLAEIWKHKVQLELVDDVNTTITLESTLSKIRCVRVFSVAELFEILNDVQSGLCAQAEGDFYGSLRVIIIDPLGSLFAPILGGSSQLGHHLMCSAGRLIKSLSSEFCLSIISTNHTVQARSSSSSSLSSSSSSSARSSSRSSSRSSRSCRFYSNGPIGGDKPALGEAWTSYPDTRIHLMLDSKSNQNAIASKQACPNGTAHLTKSPFLPTRGPEACINYSITAAGFEDVVVQTNHR